MTDLTPEDLERLVARCQTDSLFHMEEVQGIATLEEYHKKIARVVWENERTAIRSCHDMGKTWLMARIVLAIGSSYPGAKIVTTAPTARQVELLLWSEIRAGHANSKYPLGGTLLTKKWEFAPDWWAIGFTVQKQGGSGEGQANSGFQGVHSPVLVFVVFDEATGIGPDVWKQLEGLMTSAHVKFVAIGNPTTKATPFFKCFSDPTFAKLHLSCFDSPNLPANGFTSVRDIERECARLLEMGDEERLLALASYKIPRPHLVTARWVLSMALKLGVTHPLFVSKCLGEFPDEEENCLMPLGVCEEAQRRGLKRERVDGQFFMGVDVARKGGDKTVITRLEETAMRELQTLMKRELTEVQGAVIKMVNRLPMKKRLAGGVITVDATGLGAGVADNLRAYAESNREWRNVTVVNFQGAETFKAGRDGSDTECEKRIKLYANKKAEAFMLLGDDLKKELTLLEEDVLLEELPTITYKYTTKGQYLIVDKDTYKKLTGRGSPDHADSLSLANYGRHYSGGVGNMTEDLAQKDKTRAGSIHDDDEDD